MKRLGEKLVLTRAVVLPPRPAPFRTFVRWTAVAGVVVWGLITLACPPAWPLGASALGGAYLLDRTLGGAW